MTRPANPGDSGREGPEFARIDAVVGLAREIEALRRAVTPLLPVSERVDELAGLLAQVTDVVASLSARPAAVPAPSWLMLPAEEFTARRLLGELTAWLHAVFLRYPDGATSLPECWLYHPDVIEELLWLMHAWCAAYQGSAASVALAGEWHERARPGVVRRIGKSAGACSIEQHQTRPDWDQTPRGAVPVPGMESVEMISRWWAADRDRPAPEPEARQDRNGAPQPWR